VQAVAEGHATSCRKLCAAPLGVGVEWTVQVVPFQFSARVKVAFVLVTYHPTAVQADAEVHDTPFR
jgi:hypothetical protein